MESTKRPQEPGEAKASPAQAVQIDPAASAALAEAVRSARGEAKPATASSPTMEPNPSAGRWAASARLAAQAAVALLLVGAGWSASYTGTLASRDAIGRLEAEAARSREILDRLGSDVDALKQTVAAYREVEHTASTASASERTTLADKVERLAVSLQEPGKKLSSLEERLERMEGQIMATLASLSTKPAAPPAPAPAPAAPVQATEAAVREEAPAPKSLRNEPVDGWVLREVYDGAALVESRNRRLYEVMPGGILPGVGKVEAIERRGARWVVLTDKGFIGTYR
ncbi:ribonuclease E inhibitor RraB [Microvirga arsenatis]|uniref:Uncharacterized protein n=1 Tax=Microvirga arsenatis TaxID=2692265 RepID=A0ABW9YTS4_9HYPH|nr:ribonuclease E inhibitor RraB [Microvirga arsenatis]NBJ09728.1 hypothetical protein [Microvirga arsenatis]NBJ23413.1 hypothetical protein [Microvirga arsenatis]